MKLKWIHRNELDFDFWQSKTELAEVSEFQSQPWYVDCVSGKNFSFLTNTDESLWMIVPHKKKIIFDYCFTPPFMQRLSIWGRRATNDEKSIFYNELNRRFQWIDYMSSDIPEQFHTISETNRMRSNFVFELPVNKNQFNRTASNRLKKFQTHQLHISEGDIENVIGLFAENKGKEVGWNSYKASLIREIHRIGSLKYQLKSYLVSDKNEEVVAGILIAYWKNKKYFIFSGQNTKGRSTGAMTGLLHWLWNTETETYRWFDCVGSDDPGLKNFYESFGGQPVNYLHLRINKLPKLVRIFKHF